MKLTIDLSVHACERLDILKDQSGLSSRGKTIEVLIEATGRIENKVIWLKEKVQPAMRWCDLNKKMMELDFCINRCVTNRCHNPITLRELGK